jgi:hypothetical protein
MEERESFLTYIGHRPFRQYWNGGQILAFRNVLPLDHHWATEQGRMMFPLR